MTGFDLKICLIECTYYYHTDLIHPNGFRIDTIYMDFSKAFGRVIHELLVIDLQIFAMHGNFLN